MTNEELYRQYLSGDTEAFEQLYLQMQGFIASVAKDAAQSFGCSDKETLDELCAEGALELCECLSIGVYDEDRGKLTTYLHPFLRGKMYRYLEANLGAAALPKDEMQRVKQAQRLHKEELLPLDEVAQTLSAKDRAILGHTYGVFGYEKLSADELGLREMLSPDGVTKARKAALERLRSRYPGSGLYLWRDVYHALKDMSDI
jgi:RNA polymerase sigma factor (sigma-70 family)